MPAKTPIYLKSTNGKRGKKCRLRDILSPDMISPPLGDFRHTIHIGRGGERDAFGDMSFLQGRFELLQGLQAKPHYGGHGEFLRASEAYARETPSPLLQNAISLPAIGASQALTLPSVSHSADASHPQPGHTHALLLSLGVRDSGFLAGAAGGDARGNGFGCCASRASDSRSGHWLHSGAFGSQADNAETDSQHSGSKLTGSLLSLELDLGPSFLQDVLNIMERP